MNIFKRKSKLEKAVDTLTEALINDKDYYVAWQTNIAMEFKDEWQCKRSKKKYLNAQDVHEIANEAAHNFLANLTKL